MCRGGDDALSRLVPQVQQQCERLPGRRVLDAASTHSTYRPMSYSSRVMRVCALLALPTSAFAQSTKGPTIFSPASQVGTVNLRAAVVLADYTVKPLPLLKVVAVRNNERPDSTAIETDLEGRASMNLKVGMYTVLAKTMQPLGGRTYTWAVRIVVRPQQSQTLQLTNSNAAIDSVATTPSVVAEAKPAPQPTTPPQSVAPTPAQSATPPQVATSQPTPPKQAAPQAATPKTVAAQPTTPKAATPQPTAPKSTTPPKPTVPANTETKVVAKSQPPKPAPTPTQAPVKPLTPAPATPSNPPQAAASTPVTTAQSKPFVPASSPAPATKRTEVARRSRRTNTNGFIVGLAFDASSIRSDGLNNSTETGPGVAGLLGWGVTKNIALILDMSGAQISSVSGNYNLGHADIGARFHFVNRTAFVPFIDAGYAGRVVMMRNVTLTDTQGAVSTGTLSYMGSGIAAGGGLEYFVTPSIAFGGSYKWTTGKFTQVRFDNTAVDGLPLPEATSARFNMGFTWYPMGK